MSCNIYQLKKRAGFIFLKQCDPDPDLDNSRIRRILSWAIFTLLNIIHNLYRFSNLEVISCSQQHGSTLMNCDVRGIGCGSSSFGECIVQQILKPWISAGFEDYILSPRTIRLVKGSFLIILFDIMSLSCKNYLNWYVKLRRVHKA